VSLGSRAIREAYREFRDTSPRRRGEDEGGTRLGTNFKAAHVRSTAVGDRKRNEKGRDGHEGKRGKKRGVEGI